MTDSTNAAFPVTAWTWHDGKGGLLSTQIAADGQVRQERKHIKDGETMPQKLGAISAAEAAALLDHCRTALGNAATNAPAAPDGEVYELVVADSGDQKFSRHVARAALGSDAALQAIRNEVLATRKKVSRRWNIWRSAGARWMYVTMTVTLALLLYMVLDMKHDDALQKRAHATTATVTERGGSNPKDEYLKVRLDGESGTPEVRIYDYLSQPNWEAARVGGQENVLYDAQSGKAWLASDLERWQHDKKTIWVLPGFLLLTAFVGLGWLRRYEIGTYGDGNEYMIHQDRVVTDDKDLAISRSTLLWFKMFV